MEMVKPNFLIVGAARAGTTSLYYWLKQHPEVFMPEIKEPSYFVHGYGISDREVYLSLFEPGRGKKAVGEASTAYLKAYESPKWIYSILDGVKIIILLRNPVERAFSLYSWMVMEGYEWANTFEQALALEKQRFEDKDFRWNNPEYFWNYMYFRSGLYYERVRKYLEVFGNHLVKIYLFEDIISYPLEVYRDVCRFLEITDFFQPKFVRQNPSKIPRFIKLQYWLRRIQKSSSRLPKGIRFLIRKSVPPMMKLNKKIGYKGKISLELKKELIEAYYDDIMKLSELIQRNISHWLSNA